MRHNQFVTVLDLATLISLACISVCHSAFSNGQNINQTLCSTLYLLNVLPYPDKSVNSWDKAYELIPAGHLAAEQINNCTDILPGHELKLINIDSEACGTNLITKGVINVYRELVNPNRTCIVGVIGLLCSRTADAISPIISHPNIGGYVHIAASTSPSPGHHESYHFKESSLFHIIGSSSVLNEATLGLMSIYSWRRIASVHSESQFYLRSTSADFINRVLSNSEYELVAHINNYSSTETFNIINHVGARVSYWSVTPEMAAHHLCHAFQMNFTWPSYVYIFQEYYNVDRLQLLETETSCSGEELQRAMEGMFIVDYRLYIEDDMKLVSGVNYSKYQQLYSEKLKEFADNTGEVLQQNDPYANSVYDQVWAFALAINKSLKSVETLQNLSYEDHWFGKTQLTLSKILKNNLKQVSFQGASGQIDFSKNQESPTHVNIFQIQNGKCNLIGIYDPYNRNITLTEAAPHISDVPPDAFATVYQLLPLWLGICFVVLQGTLFGLTTANLLLILKWKDKTGIKATSPYLSLLMMIGCYSLCVAPMFHIARRMFVLSTVTVRFLCYLETWTSVGTDLILGVLFLKLLRVYHIFRTFGKTGRCWSDHYLLVYTLAICVGKAAIVIIWNVTNSIHPEIHKVYVKKPDQLPYYATTVTCHSPGEWFVATALYSGVLLFLLVILAVETRHIKKKNFKDTKKVNTFIFLVVMIIIISTSLRIFFHEVDHQTGTDIAEWLPSFAIPLVCQVCLFVPKTLPLALKRIIKGSA